jgi:hypothetical protein
VHRGKREGWLASAALLADDYSATFGPIPIP